MKTKNQIKSFLLSGLIGICLIVLVLAMGLGCKHTAQGVGKDMENAGEKIQEKTQ